MRITILKDKKITDEQLDRLTGEFADMFYHFEPQFFVHEWDYTFYPTYIDSDGDIRPTGSWLKKTTDWVFSKYGKWGTDHVYILIHQDNWLSDPPGPNNGIWGTNYSNIYHGYQVHYARYDRNNPANALGTFYHELMHSLDALVATYTNQRLETIVGVDNWDRDVVHGKSHKYDYIRYMENLEVIDKIKLPLKSAYDQRKEMYYKPVRLLQQIIILLKMLLNRKDGVPR